MPKFRYTIIDVHSSGASEHNGIVDAQSIEHVLVQMAQKGYVVRDVRPASANDLKIETLRKYGERLHGNPREEVIPNATWVGPEEKRIFTGKFLYRFAFVLFVVIMLIIALILEES